MRNRLLLFAVLLCGSASFAQVSNYKTVGRNNVTQRDIVAFVHQFDGEIKKATIDTTSNTALIVVEKPRGKRGKRADRTAFSYDLEEQKEIWSRKLKLLEKISKIGDYYLLSMDKAGTSTLYQLDGKTGDVLWKLGTAMYCPYIDSEKGIIMGYPNTTSRMQKKKLYNISLKDNESIWTRDFNRSLGCDYVGKINDSVLLFVASGLHSVNVNDGLGWSYEMQTDKQESYSSYPYEYVFIVDYHSNVLIDSVSATIASKDQILKLDLNGEVIWNNALPSKKTTLSRIVHNNDYVVLINHGFVIGMDSFFRSGCPYFSVFDWETGNLICQHERQQNADYFFDAQFFSDTLFVISADRKDHFSVEKYRLPDGETLAKKAFSPTDVDQIGGFFAFLDDDIYVRKDSLLEPIIKADTHSIYVKTEEMILKFNRKLTVSGNVNYKDCYELLQEHNGVRYFGHQGKIVAVASDDTELAAFDFGRMYLSEKKIYSIDNNLLYEIDLEQVVSR